MAAEHNPIGISNNPELRQLVVEARLAHTARPPHRNEWLRSIVGIATGPDDGIHDVVVNHGKYLADAYADRTKEV